MFSLILNKLLFQRAMIVINSNTTFSIDEESVPQLSFSYCSLLILLLLYYYDKYLSASSFLSSFSRRTHPVLLFKGVGILRTV